MVWSADVTYVKYWGPVLCLGWFVSPSGDMYLLCLPWSQSLVSWYPSTWYHAVCHTCYIIRGPTKGASLLCSGPNLGCHVLLLFWHYRWLPVSSIVQGTRVQDTRAEDQLSSCAPGVINYPRTEISASIHYSEIAGDHHRITVTIGTIECW